ncbi:MAG: hypothetical protein EGR43_07700 [Prevotella sp.]|nr:hypothetical protein [Prevotella sp.]
MGVFSKLFGRKTEDKKVGGMEDYMTLVRVYFQAALASQLGITNLAMLPDLRAFKTTFRVPTQNNKLGLGEKAHVKKMMKSVYDTDDNFFKEIDQSIRKKCHKLQDVNVYLIQFQTFTQDLMMLLGNLMKFKLRLPGFMKKALYTMTQKTVDDIFNKNDFNDASVVKTVMQLRQLDKQLCFSQQWVTDFVFQVLILAKKEPRPSDEEIEKAKGKLGK